MRPQLEPHFIRTLRDHEPLGLFRHSLSVGDAADELGSEHVLQIAAPVRADGVTRWHPTYRTRAMAEVRRSPRTHKTSGLLASSSSTSVLITAFRRRTRPAPSAESTRDR